MYMKMDFCMYSRYQITHLRTIGISTDSIILFRSDGLRDIGANI